VLENMGTIDAGAQIRFSIGNGVPWQLAANINRRMPRVTNGTLANVAGGNIRFNGAFTLGAARPVAFDNLRVTASKLSLVRRRPRRWRPHHTSRAAAGTSTTDRSRSRRELAGDGPHATLVFANPYPGRGPQGRARRARADAGRLPHRTEGQSTLGPFDGLINLTSPPAGRHGSVSSGSVCGDFGDRQSRAGRRRGLGPA
jgi:translocation and assembly module TamB